MFKWPAYTRASYRLPAYTKPRPNNIRPIEASTISSYIFNLNEYQNLNRMAYFEGLKRRVVLSCCHDVFNRLSVGIRPTFFLTVDLAYLAPFADYCTIAVRCLAPSVCDPSASGNTPNPLHSP